MCPYILYSIVQCLGSKVFVVRYGEVRWTPQAYSIAVVVVEPILLPTLANYIVSSAGGRDWSTGRRSAAERARRQTTATLTTTA